MHQLYSFGSVQCDNDLPDCVFNFNYISSMRPVHLPVLGFV